MAVEDPAAEQATREFQQLQDHTANAVNEKHDDVDVDVESSSTRSESKIDYPSLSKRRSAVVFLSLTGITTASSLTTGLLTVALPKMAEDLGLSQNILLWPASIYGLTSGCSLLIAGSIADLVGSRLIYLIGCGALTITMLASGLAQTPTQLIVFRGFQGVAVSLCLPTAVSILTANFAPGRRRNVGFSFVGAGQPLGYSIGLFLGGFFVDSIGWRWGWYLSAIIGALVGLLGWWALPKDKQESLSWSQIYHNNDWIGAIAASAGLGLISYVLAVITGGSNRIREPQCIALLIIAGLLLIFFPFWQHFQVKRNKPALIPNSLWKASAFTYVCIMVFLTWSAVQSIEYYLSLFFQEVQQLSAIQTSVRFIPNVAIGIVLSLVMGQITHRVSAYWIVLSTTLITSASPLLLALNHLDWSYWYALFWGVLLSPISGDALFVISPIVIASIFPNSKQALAGAVFNTVAQFGTAVGLAVVSVISSQVIEASDYQDKSSPPALLTGYRAAFWTAFGAFCVTALIGAWGLRGMGTAHQEKKAPDETRPASGLEEEEKS